jgi:YfiH family protein
MVFATRRGGRSSPPFTGLNFSSAQGDSPENVRHNYESFGRAAGIDVAKIVTARQVHGNDILIARAQPADSADADAVIAPRAGIFPGVMTADCFPVLMADPIRRVSAAVHAGREGVRLRILSKTLDTMRRRFGCRLSDIRCAIGPGIRACCYELDGGLLDRFVRDVPYADSAVSRSRVDDRDSGRLDLEAVIQHELTDRGVPPERIHTTGLCTRCNPDLFFSYRRDGALSGRHISVVGFREDSPLFP